MNLTELADLPELFVEIGEREYKFSELPTGIPDKGGKPYGLAAIQGWLNANVPHPVDALKGHLDGLPENVAIALAEKAREEAKAWPPKAGTRAGAIVLMNTEPGQIETFCWGLRVHQPEITREEVMTLYRQLAREKDSARLVLRIFSVLFGNGDPDRKEESGLPLPSSSGLDRNQGSSIGASYSGHANSD